MPKLFIQQTYPMGPIHDGSAFRRLLDEMESSYDMSLGFRKRIQEQRKDLANLSYEIRIQRSIQTALPHVGTSLSTLLRMGLRENQIVKIANLLETDSSQPKSLLQSKGECRNTNYARQPFPVSSSVSTRPRGSTPPQHHEDTDFSSFYSEVEERESISKVIAMPLRALSDNHKQTIYGLSTYLSTIDMKDAPV